MSKLDGKMTPGQEALHHTRVIQQSIKDSLEVLGAFCFAEGFMVFVPELFANDRDHTAELTWGTNVGHRRAADLTTLFNDQFQFDRLTITFIGNVNVEDDAVSYQ